MRLKVTLAITALLIAGCTGLNLNLFAPIKPYDEVRIWGEGRDKILLMDVSGILIDGAEGPDIRFRQPEGLISRVKEQLDKASGDRSVKGLILRINSPGGGVNTCDVLHHEIVSFKERTGVKVVACLIDIAASGGYYLATTADYIVANPSTVVTS